MKRDLRKRYVDLFRSFSDECLIDYYHESLCYALYVGNRADEMYDLGYDMRDIEEEDARCKLEWEILALIDKEAVRRVLSLWPEENAPAGAVGE